MFAKSVVESDGFMDLEMSARLLYFHLGLAADDEGFVAGAKIVRRMVGAGQEDMDALTEAGYLLRFPSGVVVIRHWRAHNNIRRERRRETAFVEERAQLVLTPQGVYRFRTPEDDSLSREAHDNLSQEVRSGEDRSGEDSVGEDSAGEVRTGEESIGEPFGRSDGDRPAAGRPQAEHTDPAGTRTYPQGSFGAEAVPFGAETAPFGAENAPFAPESAPEGAPAYDPFTGEVQPSGKPSGMPSGKPSREEVMEYGESIGAEEDSVRAFAEKMEAAGWLDREGRPVRSWQSMLRKWTERRRKPKPPASAYDESYYARLRAAL